jgi:hypothetical protein
MRYILFFIFSFMMCEMAWADTCPSLKELKNGKLSGWTFYSSSDDLRLSADREASFKKEAVQLALAEWISRDGKKGNVHCYYMDKEGSHLEAYIAKTNLKLSRTGHYWYPVTGGLHCAAGIARCQFNA